MKKGLKIFLVIIAVLIVLIIIAIIFNYGNNKNNQNQFIKFSSDYVSYRNLSGLILPLKYEDMSHNHTGFWPYGVQGGAHPHGHPGFDFEAKVGKPMIAVDDAKVTNIDEMTIYGEQSIVLDSGTYEGYEIYYTGQINDIQVKEDDVVKQGDIIAYFGPSVDNGIVLDVGIIHFGFNRKNIEKGGTSCPYEFMTSEAKEQLENIFEYVNSKRGDDAYQFICNPCPEGGCY